MASTSARLATSAFTAMARRPLARTHAATSSLSRDWRRSYGNVRTLFGKHFRDPAAYPRLAPVISDTFLAVSWCLLEV